MITQMAAGKSTLVVAPTHREIDAATHAIRLKLFAMGKLGTQTTSMLRLTSCNLTQADLRLQSSYRHGQVVEFISDAAGMDDEPGFKRGERVLVEGPLGNRILVRKANGTSAWLPTSQPSKYVLYDRDRIEVRVGDRIRLAKNLIGAEGAVKNLPTELIRGISLPTPEYRRRWDATHGLHGPPTPRRYTKSVEPAANFTDDPKQTRTSAPTVGTKSPPLPNSRPEVPLEQ